MYWLFQSSKPLLFPKLLFLFSWFHSTEANSSIYHQLCLISMSLAFLCSINFTLMEVASLSLVFLTTTTWGCIHTDLDNFSNRYLVQKKYLGRVELLNDTVLMELVDLFQCIPYGKKEKNAEDSDSYFSLLCPLFVELNVKFASSFIWFLCGFCQLCLPLKFGSMM